MRHKRIEPEPRAIDARRAPAHPRAFAPVRTAPVAAVVGNHALQRLLPPADVDRQQARDHVAETAAPVPAPGGFMQRKCAGGRCECESCARRPTLQRKPDSASPPTAPSSAARTPGTGGASLDGATRAYMERRFGRDFSNVRVHSDAAAQRSARALHALAYTMGHDIVFDSGRYAPGTTEGRRLIAHELAHVVQQRGQRPAMQAHPTVSRPNDAGERAADAAADAVMRGQRVTRLAPMAPGVQRKCHDKELGEPKPDCEPSTAGVVGWQFLFKVGCDDLLPGEEAKIEKFKVGSRLQIHGFASKEGKADFNERLSCHRANVIAELARAHRADCPIEGTYKHGASPVSAPGLVPDLNPPDFWRSVTVQEIKPTPEAGEIWLDPDTVINQGWALYNRAQRDPTPANLDTIAARRARLRTWLKDIPKTVAPPKAELTRRNLDEYRHFYAKAEKLWMAIDKLLALEKHADASKDTYTSWASGTGTNQGPELHAKNVPTGARYHIDIFGEGFFPGAINIGMAERTSTTGVFNSRVPNLIYRKFSGKNANKIPIADHVADLITSENGPLGFPGLADEIARIVAPGGTIILYGPGNMEPEHDKIAKAVGGTITKTIKDEAIESRIAVPPP